MRVACGVSIFTGWKMHRNALINVIGGAHNSSKRMAYVAEAVASITSAIEMERRGELQSAFDSYLAGIGELLRGAQDDPDSVRGVLCVIVLCMFDEHLKWNAALYCSLR